MEQDKLTIGEQLKLNDGKTYLCINVVEDQARLFALLITNHEPLEMCFVEQLPDSLRIVGSKDEKQYLKHLFERSVAENGEENV